VQFLRGMQSFPGDVGAFRPVPLRIVQMLRTMQKGYTGQAVPDCALCKVCRPTEERSLWVYLNEKGPKKGL
jgi:hypothetical protein